MASETLEPSVEKFKNERYVGTAVRRHIRTSFTLLLAYGIIVQISPNSQAGYTLQI